MKRGFVYILTNKWNSVFYIGVTSDILRRIGEHRNGVGSVFASKYNLKKLVLVEELESVVSAIEREKQLKAGSRASKIRLIEKMNPDWKDLSSMLG
jgi:putative endonuclease